MQKRPGFDHALIIKLLGRCCLLLRLTISRARASTALPSCTRPRITQRPARPLPSTPPHTHPSSRPCPWTCLRHRPQHRPRRSCAASPQRSAPRRLRPRGRRGYLVLVPAAAAAGPARLVGGRMTGRCRTRTRTRTRTRALHGLRGTDRRVVVDAGGTDKSRVRTPGARKGQSATSALVARTDAPPRPATAPTSHRILTTSGLPHPFFQQLSPASLFLLASRFRPSTPSHACSCRRIASSGFSHCALPAFAPGAGTSAGGTGSPHAGQSGVGTSRPATRVARVGASGEAHACPGRRGETSGESRVGWWEVQKGRRQYWHCGVARRRGGTDASAPAQQKGRSALGTVPTLSGKKSTSEHASWWHRCPRKSISSRSCRSAPCGVAGDRARGGVATALRDMVVRVAGAGGALEREPGVCVCV